MELNKTFCFLSGALIGMTFPNIITVLLILSTILILNEPLSQHIVPTINPSTNPSISSRDVTPREVLWQIWASFKNPQVESSGQTKWIDSVFNWLWQNSRKN